MNDIRELTRFRETIPDDPAARARARNRLTSRLLDHRGIDHRGIDHRGGAHRRRRVTRRVVVATAVAALAAGAVIVADSMVVRDQPVGASAAAATLLNQAADRAIGSTDPVVGPDEYLHVTTVRVDAVIMIGPKTEENPVGYLFTDTHELFIPGDPDKEWVSRVSPSVPYRPEDAQFAEEHGSVFEGTVDTTRSRDGFGGEVYWGNPSPELLAALPRDPQQLLHTIREFAADAGPSRDGMAFDVIAEMLRSGIVPGDLRAALFRAAALIPGVEVIEEQANVNGQIGVAVGRYESGWGTRKEIIFDPDTGLMIGERDVLVDRGFGPLLPAGSAVSWTAVTTDVVPAAVVDDIPADPTQ